MHTMGLEPSITNLEINYFSPDYPDGRVSQVSCTKIFVNTSHIQHTAIFSKCLIVTQTSMNVTLQMEAVNTIVLTPLGASYAAVTWGTSWMQMDWIAVVRVYSKWKICVFYYIESVVQRLWANTCSITVDINECDTANGGCEHNCTNTIGSFICSCDTEYELDENGLNCSGKDLLEMKDLCVLLHRVSCTESSSQYFVP